MSLEYLEQDAKKYLEEATALNSLKPEKAKQLQITGHTLLLSFYLVNNSPEIENELETLLSLEIEYFAKHPAKAYVWKQNDYALLCLSYDKVSLGIKILSFPADYEGYTQFPVLLNLKLRKLLGAEQNSFAKTRKISVPEQLLLDSFEAVIEGQSVNWEAVSSFWKSTKSKRFKNTIFEHNDLFTKALRNAALGLTHHSSGTPNGAP
jgi:hypothetical protein